MAYLKISGDEQFLCLRYSLEEIDQLLIIRCLSVTLKKLRNVEHPATPRRVDIAQLRLDKMPSVARRVVWQDVTGLLVSILSAGIWRFSKSPTQKPLQTSDG